jgi:hypothetical protein
LREVAAVCPAVPVSVGVDEGGTRLANTGAVPPRGVAVVSTNWTLVLRADATTVAGKKFEPKKNARGTKV